LLEIDQAFELNLVINSIEVFTNIRTNKPLITRLVSLNVDLHRVNHMSTNLPLSFFLFDHMYFKSRFGHQIIF